MLKYYLFNFEKLSPNSEVKFRCSERRNECKARKSSRVKRNCN